MSEDKENIVDILSRDRQKIRKEFSKGLPVDKRIRYAATMAVKDVFEKLPEEEREVLRQFNLLTELTNHPWEKDFLRDESKKETEEKEKVAILIGTGQTTTGRYSRAQEIGKKLEETGNYEVVYVITGGIGLQKQRAQELGVKGKNAESVKYDLINDGVDENKIIVENKSENTPEQAENIKAMFTEDKRLDGIKRAIAVVDRWHLARFVATFINKGPNIEYYTDMFIRDKHGFGGAPYDYGQGYLQISVFMSDLARYRKYANEGSGPANLDQIIDYYEKHFSETNPNMVKAKIRTKRRLEKSFEEFPMDNKTAQGFANRRVKAEI